MGVALTITRLDHTAAELREAASKSGDAAQVRRLLAIAHVLDVESRTEAAQRCGMERQTLRDWIPRYNELGIDGLKSRTSPGRAPLLTPAQKAELRALVVEGPAPSATKWCDGAAWICNSRSRVAFRSRCMRAPSANGCTSLA